jgi:hypothetical protein
VEDTTSSKPEDRGDGERTEDYPKLISYGLDKKVSLVVWAGSGTRTDFLFSFVWFFQKNRLLVN